jgi:hypothetical protein
MPPFPRRIDFLQDPRPLGTLPFPCFTMLSYLSLISVYVCLSTFIGKTEGMEKRGMGTPRVDPRLGSDVNGPYAGRPLRGHLLVRLPGERSRVHDC